jgi:uncharacterized protein YjbI with pentapeptide repeats
MTIRTAAMTDMRATKADLPDLTMSDVQLQECDFSDTVLTGATFRKVSGRNNSFKTTQLAHANFLTSHLIHSDFRGANAENIRFISCVMPDSKFTYLDNESRRSAFIARGMTVRDCDFNRADFTGAYLYRASFTGDPVTGMQLQGASFRGANLIQAYIAANLIDSDFCQLIGAYSRFNQSDLTNAKLNAATLYQASFVKVKLAHTSLLGVKAPIFMDRCPEADTALLDSDLASWQQELAETLSRRPSGST